MSARVGVAISLLFLLVVSSPPSARTARADAPLDLDAGRIERRIGQAAQYLASDALEGRAVGTKGLDLAAEFIARQFADARLKTDLLDGKPFQPFILPGVPRLGPNNALALVGPAAPGSKEPSKKPLKPGDDYSPMWASASQAFDLPLVFVGYGITGQAEKYDDYAGLDVRGKAVVILRREPQQADPKSVFNGVKESEHATFRRKLANAKEHGAAAVIFCTDDFSVEHGLAGLRKQLQAASDKLISEQQSLERQKGLPPDERKKRQQRIDDLAKEIGRLKTQLKAQADPLFTVGSLLTGVSAADIPVVHCHRQVIDPLVESVTGKSLAQWEREIDHGPTPYSAELSGWRAVGRTDVARQEAAARNVLAVLEGQGPTAEETIVVGAHYDHIGRGLYGSLAGSKEIHYGADDNASGTAVMLEVARQLAARKEKLPRRIVFAAFSAEERGILGSMHYVEHPLVPLDKTIAMVNLDMVGRLREDRLMVLGTGTSKAFDGLVDTAGRSRQLILVKLPAWMGPSDQLSFVRRQIPILSFFTGLHADYHRPSDTFDKLNVPGMRQVALLVTDVVASMAQLDARPVFTQDSSSAKRVVLGVVTEPEFTGEGVKVRSLVPKGPAEKAGMKEGDAIIRFAAQPIRSFADLLKALENRKPGEQVKVDVRRQGVDRSLDVELAPGQ